MIEVMADGDNDGGHLFHGEQVIAEDGLIYEAGHGLGDVGRVDAVVIWVGGVVVALKCSKRPRSRNRYVHSVAKLCPLVSLSRENALKFHRVLMLPRSWRVAAGPSSSKPRQAHRVMRLPLVFLCRFRG